MRVGSHDFLWVTMTHLWVIGVHDSSESQFPSKYQNSLRSDHPLVSYKYLIFLIFPSPLAPHMVKSGKRLYQVDLCSSLTRLPIFIILAGLEASNSPKHWTPPPNSPKSWGSPVRFRQSRIKDICLFPLQLPSNVNRSGRHLK